MKDNSNIIESLDIIVNNQSISNGKLRPHSLGLLILVWILVLVLGLFAYYVLPTLFTMIVALLSISFVICGTALYKSNNYRWFLYLFYNTCAGSVIVANVFLGLSYWTGRVYMIAAICIFIITISLTGTVTHIIIAKRIKRKLIKSHDKTAIKATSSLGLFSGGVGIIISRMIPDNATPIIVMLLVGSIMGSVCATTLTIYYYGKKYDPDCELIKNIQAVTEKNDVP